MCFPVLSVAVLPQPALLTGALPGECELPPPLEAPPPLLEDPPLLLDAAPLLLDPLLLLDAAPPLLPLPDDPLLLLLPPLEDPPLLLLDAAPPLLDEPLLLDEPPLPLDPPELLEAWLPLDEPPEWPPPPTVSGASWPQAAATRTEPSRRAFHRDRTSRVSIVTPRKARARAKKVQRGPLAPTNRDHPQRRGVTVPVGKRARQPCTGGAARGGHARGAYHDSS